MALSIHITCDGEGCRNIAQSAYISMAHGTGQRIAGATLDNDLQVDTGWLPLADCGWTVRHVDESQRYPQGLRFICPACQKVSA